MSTRKKESFMDCTLEKLVGRSLILQLTEKERMARRLSPTDDALRSVWVSKILNGKCPRPRGISLAIRELEKTWMEELENSGFGFDFTGKFIVPNWSGKEIGQVIYLLDRYCGRNLQIMMRYVIRQWNRISARYLKGRGVEPTLSFLLRFDVSLMPEAQHWVKSIDVVYEYKAWKKENPTVIRPPGDLLDRYTKARRKLAAIGL